MKSQFSGAIMDTMRQHRFILWRFWDERPRMLFIGLNPSRANEMKDDPTVKLMCRWAQDWGYGGIYACNLFSYVTPRPNELLPVVRDHAASTPALKMALALTVLTVCGWGDGIKLVKEGAERASFIRGLLSSPMCFGLTASGSPKHPLYLPRDSKLYEYNLPEGERIE